MSEHVKRMFLILTPLLLTATYLVFRQAARPRFRLLPRARRWLILVCLAIAWVAHVVLLLGWLGGYLDRS